MMKTLNILFLLLLFQSNAQIPSYFENNQKWICNESQYGIVLDGCFLNDDYLYYISGDTSIVGNTYKKIMRKGWTNEAGFCYTPPAYYEEFYCGFRQVDRKIYINRYGQDSLYIDYDLSIGDTIKPCYLRPNLGFLADGNFIVQSIDSVLFSSGYHHRYYFNYYGFFNDTIPYFLLEGVGVFSANGMSGLNEMHQIITEPFEWFGTIHCYLQDDNFEFGSGSCNLTQFDFNVGLEEHDLLTKKLIKTVDSMGRETKEKPNTLLIYIYDDGTTEKVFRVE